MEADCGMVDHADNGNTEADSLTENIHHTKEQDVSKDVSL
jgi:hypothetical protein